MEGSIKLKSQSLWEKKTQNCLPTDDRLYFSCLHTYITGIYNADYRGIVDRP